MTGAQLLRSGLLEGVGVTVAGEPSPFGAAVGDRVAALGAHDGDDTFMWDASALAEPRAALDGAWDAIRPVATHAMIPRGDGQILLLAPAPGSAGGAAARAGLENMARTLSIEWARFAVRPAAILPGTTTSPAEVAELVAFLASRAGRYYAGCAFTLGSAAAA